MRGIGAVLLWLAIFRPRQWSITVPRTFSRTRLHIDSLATKVYFVQPILFEIGKTSGDFNGVQLAVYDRERTICDCFKYRTKLDNECLIRHSMPMLPIKRKT